MITYNGGLNEEVLDQRSFSSNRQREFQIMDLRQYILYGNDNMATMELNVVIETKDVPNDEAKRTVEDAKIENARIFFEQLKLDGYEVKFCRQLQNKKIANIISELIENE